ncbi:MAG: hypothetical protein IJJ33_07375 [Victivallales bacterium]|nr:hypothetical protein [Victivallales bacterium]
METRQQQKQLRLQAMSWLVSCYGRPDAIGLRVKLRSRHDPLDVGAVWLSRGKESDKSLIPRRAVAVQCCATRSQCWPTCGTSEEMVKYASELYRRREELQLSIQREEPELRDREMLFDELAFWHYEASANPQYQALVKEIAQLERAIYQGSALECLSAPPVADLLYLAVPSGLLSPGELREDWGLLWLNQDGSTDVIRQATSHDCTAQERLRMLRAILSAEVHKLMRRQRKRQP